MHRFPASYDRTTKIITSIVVLTLLIIVAFVHIVVVSVLLFLVPILVYAWSPRGYEIEGSTIMVKRVIGDAQIPLEGVHEIRRITKDDLRGAIRLWGSGGFFGYYGLFRTTKLGKCTWYITNRRNAIVIVTESKTVLLSPDNVDGFLEAVRPYWRKV